MDIYDRLTRMLKPIGGQLIIDAFMDEAERGRRVQRARKEDIPLRAQVAAASAAGAGSTDAFPEPAESLLPHGSSDAPPPQEPQDSLTDTDRLRLEVREFMTRENADNAVDDEIKEFMKERHGFDPSEMK